MCVRKNLDWEHFLFFVFFKKKERRKHHNLSFFFRKKKERARMYTKPFYKPVSFVLFLISLTYPTKPDARLQARYNAWFKLLFDILPIDLPFDTILTSLKYDPVKNPFRSRLAFVNLVFQLHEAVFNKPIDRAQMFGFFESLRATNCQSVITEHQESGCNRIQRIPFVTNILFYSPNADDKKEEEPDFVVHKELQNDVAFQTAYDDPNIEMKSLQNTNSFCSCVFSPKWLLLHMIASQYKYTQDDIAPPDVIAKYDTWLRIFGEISACQSCRENFNHNLQMMEYNPHNDLQSRYTFQRCLFRLHETVNTMLQQPNIYFHDMVVMYRDLHENVKDNFECMIAIVPKKTSGPRYRIVI